MQAKAALTLFRAPGPAWRLALIALGVTLAAGAPAQEQVDLRGMLNSYVAMLEDNCKRYETAAQEARDKGDAEQILMISQVKQTMCQCHPAKARALLATLPKEKLDQAITGEKDFVEVATPGILEPCAGEQMRAMYDGDNCAAMKSLKSDKKVDVDKFCGCMRGEVLGYSDADAAVIGQEFSTYIPKAAEAKKNGTALPSRSATLSRFIGSMRKCGGAGEMME